MTNIFNTIVTIKVIAVTIIAQQRNDRHCVPLWLVMLLAIPRLLRTYVRILLRRHLLYISILSMVLLILETKRDDLMVGWVDLLRSLSVYVREEIWLGTILAVQCHRFTIQFQLWRGFHRGRATPICDISFPWWMNSWWPASWLARALDSDSIHFHSLLRLWGVMISANQSFLACR